MPYLLKTEPNVYSFADLQREHTTIWDGVTNPVALKNLRGMKPGEPLVIYHTADEKSAVGTATVVSVDPSDPKNKKGPLTLAAAGSYNTGKENSQGRFVVFGSSSWAANSFLKFNGNRDLALNTMNWLSSDEDLISIRPKEAEDRRLNATQSQMNMFEYTVLFAFALIIIAAGVSLFLKRR